MATLTPVLNGDSGVQARTKINNNDALINSELATLTNKYKGGVTGVLLAGSRTVTFSTPFPDAAYGLTVNVYDTNGVKSDYKRGAQTASGFTLVLSFDSIINYTAIRE